MAVADIAVAACVDVAVAACVGVAVAVTVAVAAAVGDRALKKWRPQAHPQRLREEGLRGCGRGCEGLMVVRARAVAGRLPAAS